jgi:hypothetical protein
MKPAADWMPTKKNNLVALLNREPAPVRCAEGTATLVDGGWWWRLVVLLMLVLVLVLVLV